MKIQLSDQELAKITKPIKGQGGFQTLLRRIQKQTQGSSGSYVQRVVQLAV